MPFSNPVFVLPAANAGFIQSAVAINVAGRGPGNILSVSRAYGCSVSSDRGAVTVFVYPEQCEKLIQHVRGNGIIAAVFSRPSSNETLQLKSTTSEIVPVTGQDLLVMEAYRKSFARELSAIGFASGFTQAMVPVVEASALGIRFRPQEIFSQTPGPDAGKRLEP